MRIEELKNGKMEKWKNQTKADGEVNRRHGGMLPVHVSASYRAHSCLGAHVKVAQQHILTAAPGRGGFVAVSSLPALPH